MLFHIYTYISSLGPFPKYFAESTVSVTFFFFFSFAFAWHIEECLLRVCKRFLLAFSFLLSVSFYRLDWFLFLSHNLLYIVYIRYIRVLNAIISCVFLESSLQDSKLIDKQRLMITNKWHVYFYFVIYFKLYILISRDLNYRQFSSCFTRYP